MFLISKLLRISKIELNYSLHSFMVKRLIFFFNNQSFEECISHVSLDNILRNRVSATKQRNISQPHVL